MTDLDDALLQVVGAELIWDLDYEVVLAAEEQIRSSPVDEVVSTLLRAGGSTLSNNSVLFWLLDFPEVLLAAMQEDDDFADAVYDCLPSSKLIEEVPREVVANRLQKGLFRTDHSDWPISVFRSLPEFERWEMIVEICEICATNPVKDYDDYDFELSWIYYVLGRPTWWNSRPDGKDFGEVERHAETIWRIVVKHRADGRDPRGWFKYLWNSLPGCKVSQEWCCKFIGLASALDGVRNELYSPS